MRLTVRQRAAFDLFERGFSIAEIAEQLGICWQAARERIARGLKRMKVGRPMTRHNRSWALAALVSHPARSEFEACRLLALHFMGFSHGEVGGKLG
jgi:DNA-binding NarL/FixJ family response regulator